MKRIVIESPSSIDGLRVIDCDVPTPGPGEVLLRVGASSLNFHDYLVVTGILKAPPGRTPLSDAVGEIVGLGEGVTRFAIGDRAMSVYAPRWKDGPPTREKTHTWRGDQIEGFAAEYVAVDAEDLTRAPAGLSDIEAATLPCAAITAWNALFITGGVKPGDTILTQGTGGVSIFALQLAKTAGIKVISLSSSEAKLERLKSLGADHVINYVEQPAWSDAVRKLTDGKGVDLVVEVVGGDLTQTLRAQRLQGRTALIGALSRQPISFPSLPAIAGYHNIMGLMVGSRTDQEEMVRAIELNGLKPVIDRTFSFLDLKDAFRHQEAKSHFGKIAISW